jgi:hypothetical protein
MDEAEARARVRRGVEQLAAGDYAEGFRLYDAWRQVPAYRATTAAGDFPRDFPIPRWRGEDLAGKRILVVGEEGFGDQIMYARFVRELQRVGALVGWLVTPVLARLFGEALGVAILAKDRAHELGVFDYYCPSSALPLAFFPPLETPPDPPYLAAPPPIVLEGKTLGVALQGNPNHANNSHRSLGSRDAARLLGLPQAVSLLPEATGAQDFHDTARLIAGLDLVITVDTAAAHLAGAMGKPVWVLLPASDVDWRWGLADRSPWYPAARLFRQARSGDWGDTVARVLAELTVR